MFCTSIDTGWEPGKPLLETLKTSLQFSIFFGLSNTIEKKNYVSQLYLKNINNLFIPI